MHRILVSVLASMLLVSGAAAAASAEAPSCTAAVTEDTELHTAMLKISPEEFSALGFRFGDSCNIRFPDGQELKDIPYYNGYYTRSGEPLLVLYPGYEYIHLSINNGDPSWTFYGFREGGTVTVTLAQAGKYTAIQDAMNTVYTNDRTDYPDDAAFANFRAMAGGRLKKDTFYRGASPADNTYGRAPYADRLLRDAGIRFVLDLADTEEKLRDSSEASHSEYLLSLAESGLVDPLSLTSAYLSEPFRQSLVSGLREMMKHEGPYYIHCQEGKDRTGFVCMLLEALCGASEAELEADYMKTYDNYYGIAPGSDRYEAIRTVKFLDLLSLLAGPGGDPEAGARDYLLGSGMTAQEADSLARFLSGE